MRKKLVSQISRYCNKMAEIVFDSSDETIRKGTLFVSQNQAGNGFLLKDCWFGPNRARGFICNASFGRVENCVFEGISAQAVKSAPSYGWLEGGVARDVVFDRCVFIDCPVFFGVAKDMLHTADCHRNITFSNCRFKGSKARLEVLACNGLLLQNNQFDASATPRVTTQLVIEKQPAE